MNAVESTARRLTWMAAVSAAHGAVSIIVGAVSAALVYRHLGPEFGVFALVSTGMVRFNLLEDSLGNYVITTVSSACREEGACDRRAAQVGAALVASIASALVLAAVFAGALFALYHARPDVPLLAVLGAAGLLLAATASYTARTLEGCAAYRPLRALQSAILLARLAALAWLVLVTGAGLLPVLALYAATPVVLAIAGAGVARRRVPVGIGHSLRTVDRASFRDLRHFVQPLLLAKGVAVVSYRLDLWIVQAFVGPIGAAAYALAETLGNLLLQAIEVFKVLLPVSVQSWRAGDPSWIGRFVLGASKAQVFVVGGLCVALWANLDAVLGLWFGSVPEATRTAASLLLLFVALTAVRSSVQTVLIGQEKAYYLERPFLVGGGINVVVSVAATAAFGAWGPALGTAVAGIFLLAMVIPASETALALPAATLVRRLVTPSLIALGLCAGLGAIPFAPLGRIEADLALRTLAVGIAFSALFWVVVLDAEERHWIVARLRRGGLP